MNIELTTAYLDRPLFLSMAKDYIDTLALCDDRIRWDEATWRTNSWKARFIMEDRTVQGFIVYEIVPFDFYPPAVYIKEIYVVPEARRRGIATAAVKAAVGNWDGDVFLYILNENKGARLFWTDVEAELGWKKINRPEIDEEDGCELRVYQTR